MEINYELYKKRGYSEKAIEYLKSIEHMRNPLPLCPGNCNTGVSRGECNKHCPFSDENPKKENCYGKYQCHLVTGLDEEQRLKLEKVESTSVLDTIRNLALKLPKSDISEQIIALTKK